MTETQAKSGTGTSTDSSHSAANPDGAGQPPTETPDKIATSAESGRAESAAPESTTTVIRRSGAGTVEATRGEKDEKATSATEPAQSSSKPVMDSSPTTRLSVAEAAARAESTARSAPGRTGTAPASAPTGRAAVPSTTSRRPATATPGVGDASPARSAAGAVTAAAAVGAARVSETLRAARATVAGAASRGPRRARLHLKRIDPWSVMKFSFAVSLVLFFVAIVATSVLYLALDAMGVFGSLNTTISDIAGQSGAQATGFRITFKGVIGTSILLGAVNMVLFTALATLGAFVYNVCADLVGGIELTLSEKE